ncbi:hypothetical protein Tco_1441324, partial [Tanacetum coccineum]
REWRGDDGVGCDGTAAGEEGENASGVWWHGRRRGGGDSGVVARGGASGGE